MQLRRAFPDGIAWVALGQTPDLLAVQNRLLRLLDPRAQPAETQVEGHHAPARHAAGSPRAAGDR
jgi:hypothetical protein